MLILTDRCTVSSSTDRTCDYHRERPYHAGYAGCTCSSSYSIGPCPDCSGTGFIGGKMCPRYKGILNANKDRRALIASDSRFTIEGALGG